MSMFLVMSTHFLKCIVALLPYLRQPGRVIVTNERRSAADLAFQIEIVDYLNENYEGSERN